MLRNGEQATLSVFGPRPVDLAAKTLVDEFRVTINVEDPLYFHSDDVQFSHIAASGKRVMIPRASLLEVRFDLRPDGSLRDVRQVLADLVETANAQLPFAIASTATVTLLRWSPHERGTSKGVRST